MTPAELPATGARVDERSSAAPSAPPSSARSTGVVGIGVIVLGLGTYVFLALAARALDLSAFARLSVVVTAIITAGPGLFLPIEQEVSRGLAHRLAIGQSGRSLIRKAAEIGGIFAVLAVVVVAAAGFLGLDTLLDGDVSLLIALICGVLALLPAHLSRGVLAGSGHITRYAVQLTLDGVLRALGAAVLIVCGVHTPWLYAVPLTAAPLIAVAVSLVGLSVKDVAGSGAPRPASRKELAPALGYLVCASFAMQALANAGPTAVKIISGPDSDQAGPFLAALVLARSPLFIVIALQATLVPAWAALLAHGHISVLRRRIRAAIAGTAAAALAIVPIAVLLGPLALRIIYGPSYELPRYVLALLAASTGLFCVAVIASLALVAQGRQAAVCGGWSLGFAVFLLGCFVPLDPSVRVALALGVGALASIIWFIAATRRGALR